MLCGAVYCCILLFDAVCFCMLLCVFVCCCVLLYVAVSCCLMSISFFINFFGVFHILLVHLQDR